jgi:hypothetical protein
LSETDLAVHYLQAIGGAEQMAGNAQALVEGIKAWLRRSRLDHRLADAVDITIEANEVAKQVRAQEAFTPAEAAVAWSSDVQQGYGNQRPEMSELAAHVVGLDMRQFAAPSTFDHLAGSNQ